jgi:hypothetical protein
METVVLARCEISQLARAGARFALFESGTFVGSSASTVP